MNEEIEAELAVWKERAMLASEEDSKWDIVNEVLARYVCGSPDWRHRIIEWLQTASVAPSDLERTSDLVSAQMQQLEKLKGEFRSREPQRNEERHLKDLIEKIDRTHEEFRNTIDSTVRKIDELRKHLLDD